MGFGDSEPEIILTCPSCRPEVPRNALTTQAGVQPDQGRGEQRSDQASSQQVAQGLATPAGRVHVRHGDPELIVTTAVAPPPPLPPEAPDAPESEAFDEARITLRIPGYLKDIIADYKARHESFHELPIPGGRRCPYTLLVSAPVGWRRGYRDGAGATVGRTQVRWHVASSGR